MATTRREPGVAWSSWQAITVRTAVTICQGKIRRKGVFSAAELRHLYVYQGRWLILD
ncbi:hypothetical protein BJX70DRAFT_376583 [Aspergillus crustosus]